jgi:hypothetical protein
VPANGATVSNLFAVASAAPGAGKSYTVTVQTVGSTPTVLLSCTISTTSTTCNNTASSTAVAAGAYLEVLVGNTGTAAAVSWTVSFRY